MGIREEWAGLRVRVEGQLTFNDSYPMIGAALEGFGIAYSRKTWWRSTSGRVGRVLDDWSPVFELLLLSALADKFGSVQSDR